MCLLEGDISMKWEGKKEVKFSMKPCPKKLGKMASEKKVLDYVILTTRGACNNCNANFIKSGLDNQALLK
jgi:hypothetical protein